MLTAPDRVPLIDPTPPSRSTMPAGSRAHRSPLAVLALLACLLASPAPAFAQATGTPPYRDARLPTDARVRDLLARMTLEEKFWQLYMSPGSLDDPAHDYSHGAFGLQIPSRLSRASAPQERRAFQVPASVSPFPHQRAAARRAHPLPARPAPSGAMLPNPPAPASVSPVPHQRAAARRAHPLPARPTSSGAMRKAASSPRTAGAIARAHAERINAIQRYFVERTRLGIPIIPFEEALHGLRHEGATVFPQAIALAATWDTALVARVSIAAARETRSRGIRMALSPVVNIASDVRGGRAEEAYGEDPHLASAMARAFVSAFEGAGVVATPKHFVANVGDGGRDSYPIDWSERLLEELHFPPFRAALDAGARSVMTAYNSVDGAPATQNRWLLNGKLKGEWGFTGFVIS